VARRSVAGAPDGDVSSTGTAAGGNRGGRAAAALATATHRRLGGASRHTQAAPGLCGWLLARRGAAVQARRSRAVAGGGAQDMQPQVLKAVASPVLATRDAPQSLTWATLPETSRPQHHPPRPPHCRRLPPHPGARVTAALLDHSSAQPTAPPLEAPWTQWRGRFPPMWPPPRPRHSGCSRP